MSRPEILLLRLPMVADMTGIYLLSDPAVPLLGIAHEKLSLMFAQKRT
jgi:hypothetical protein